MQTVKFLPYKRTNAKSHEFLSPENPNLFSDLVKTIFHIIRDFPRIHLVIQEAIAVVLYVACFGVSCCTVSPSVCLDVGLGS